MSRITFRRDRIGMVDWAFLPRPESEGGGVSSRGVWRTNLPAALRIKRPSASIARGDAKPSTAPQPRKRRGGQCVTIQIR